MSKYLYVFCLLTGLSALVAAEELVVQELSVSHAHDTNYKLDGSNPKRLGSSQVEYAPSYRWRDDRVDTRVFGQVSYIAYNGDNEEIENGESGALGVNSTIDAHEQLTISGALSVSSENTTADEYEEFLGFIGVAERSVDKRKNTAQLDSEVSYLLSERWSSRASIFALATEYDDAEATQLVDYQYKVYQGVLTNALTEQYSAYLSVQYADFSPEPSSRLIQKLSSVSNQTTSALVGIQVQFDAQHNMQVAIGRRWSDFSSELRDSSGSDSGRQFEFSTSRAHSDTTQVSLSVTEQVEPSSNGSATLKRRAELKNKHALKEHLAFEYAFAYEYEEERFSGAQTDSEELYSVRAALSKRLSREQRLQFRARYRSKEQSASAESTKVEVVWSLKLTSK